MSARRAGRTWLCALLLLGACTEPNRKVRLQFQLHGSCSPTQDYDISCVQALRLDVRDLGGETLASSCTNVTGRYANVQALIGSSEMVPLLGDVRLATVRLELRGYHVIDKPPCTDLSDDELMLWGSSAPVDLRDTGLGEINIITECRPACDCADFQYAMAATCPRELAGGACTPAVNQLCRAECDDDHGCYAGLMHCIDGRCVPDTGAPCAACDSGEDCASNLCVENAQTKERFCALPCPPLPDVDPCPIWMSCKRLNDGIFSRAGSRP